MKLELLSEDYSVFNKSKKLYRGTIDDISDYLKEEFGKSDLQFVYNNIYPVRILNGKHVTYYMNESIHVMTVLKHLISEAKAAKLKKKKPTVKFDPDQNEIVAEKKNDDPCWDNYEQIGTKTKNGKEVPNCVPVNEDEQKFTPPKAAQANARLVLNWKEKYKDEVDAMTQTGWVRARQLADGDEISLDIVKRMAMFNRHKQNSKVSAEYKNTPWKDRGYVAWLGWGGDEGVEWAIETLKKNQ